MMALSDEEKDRIREEGREFGKALVMSVIELSSLALEAKAIYLSLWDFRSLPRECGMWLGIGGDSTIKSYDDSIGKFLGCDLYLDPCGMSSRIILGDGTPIPFILNLLNNELPSLES